MAKGGYQILDFGGTNFTVGNAVKVAGIWEKVEGNYHKVLLVENLSFRGVEQTAFWVTATSGDNNYTLLGFEGYSITVSNDDEITFTETASPASFKAKK